MNNPTITQTQRQPSADNDNLKPLPTLFLPIEDVRVPPPIIPTLGTLIKVGSKVITYPQRVITYETPNN